MSSIKLLSIAVYGVWKNSLSWMIPFLILYAGLIIECLAILVFILVGDTSLKSHNIRQSYLMRKK